MERLKAIWSKISWIFGVLAGLGGLLTAAFFASESRKNARKMADLEFARLQAEAKTERVLAEAGRAAAIAHVEKEYANEIKALDEAGKQKTAELQNDPIALSSFLVDAGRRKRT